MTNGITQYTQKPMLAGTPHSSAALHMKNQQTIQANNNRLLAGGKYKINKKKTRRRVFKKKRSKSFKKKSKSFKKRRYNGGAIVVQQPNMLYQPQGGPGQTPHALMAKNAAIQSQGHANAVYDNKAYSGGKSKHDK